MTNTLRTRCGQACVVWLLGVLAGTAFLGGSVDLCGLWSGGYVFPSPRFTSCLTGTPSAGSRRHHSHLGTRLGRMKAVRVVAPVASGRTAAAPAATAEPDASQNPVVISQAPPLAAEASPPDEPPLLPAVASSLPAEAPPPLPDEPPLLTAQGCGFGAAGRLDELEARWAAMLSAHDLPLEVTSHDPDATPRPIPSSSPR